MKYTLLKLIVTKVATYLINLGFSWLFRKVDTDKDGLWSQKEINDFVKEHSNNAKKRLVKKKQNKLK